MKIMKPKIRGFPRSQMQPGVMGWVLKTNDQVWEIRYQVPLRRNWLIRMNGKPGAQVVQSRSGSIHLLAARDKPLPVSRAKVTLAAGGLALSCAIGFLYLFDDEASISRTLSETAKSSATSAPLAVDESYDCMSKNLVSVENLESTLSGITSNLKVLTKQVVVQLGGFRGTALLLQCDTQTFRVNVSEIKVDSIWKLNKASRLEN
jgi:hypothetical protein